MKKFNPRLYLISDPVTFKNRSLMVVVEEAIKGGVTMVQLREKKASEEELIAKGRVLRAITRKYNVPLIVNDNVRVTLAIDAQGLHIGQNDITVRQARALLGVYKILGVSAKTVEEAKRAQRDGADYLGVGPIFQTKTKKDAGEPIGLKQLSEIVCAVSLPVVAIGGITAKNAAEFLRTGVAGLAVVSAVIQAKDPQKATQELLRVFTKYE